MDNNQSNYIGQWSKIKVKKSLKKDFPKLDVNSISKCKIFDKLRLKVKLDT